MRTYSAKPAEIVRKWYVIDADGQPLGRMATRVARVLRGKHKVTFTPHVDTGDHVIVVNAGKIHLTGDKPRQKMYYRHTGYPGGLKTESAEAWLARDPAALVERAIKGMLPKNPLGKHMGRKLRVYAGATHPHKAQTVEALTI
jgi:large subunit ribosomal protein L13